jgi:hypothetical protein
VVCNGEAITEHSSTGGGGTINNSRLYFLDTFIYKKGYGCMSKCADLDEENIIKIM